MYEGMLLSKQLDVEIGIVSDRYVSTEFFPSRAVSSVEFINSISIEKNINGTRDGIRAKLSDSAVTSSMVTMCNCHLNWALWHGWAKYLTFTQCLCWATIVRQLQLSSVEFICPWRWKIWSWAHWVCSISNSLYLTPLRPPLSLCLRREDSALCLDLQLSLLLLSQLTDKMKSG